MPIVELIPLNKGNQIVLDNNIITTMGRTANIGCVDNKISRNHAQIFVKSDDTVWVKPIHHNPTFYKTKTNQIVSLTKDKEYQLHNNDQFGLLPDEYFYRVSIKSKDEDIDNQTIPNSSVETNENLTIENHDADQVEVTTSAVSNKTRPLPTWISDSSASTSKQSSERPVTTSSVKNRIDSEVKKTKKIVYDDDDDDEEPTAATSSTAHADTSNDIGLITNSQTSSTVTNPTKRERCPYGESCYRQNATHRQQAIHPGDPDWDTKKNDTNKTKPECPYGDECYRKNADHLNEYHHPKKPRTKKRKASEDDDDDGLPNTYDYNDSFIDNEESDESDHATDNEESSEDEWRPQGESQKSDDNSTDDSEKNLTRREAALFIKDSSADNHGPVIKKPRRDDEDDD